MTLLELYPKADELAREKPKSLRPLSLHESLLRIGRECAALPIMDVSQRDEMLGYDDQGVLI